jgi:protein-tyrosine-phosphatase/DNA-binding HxlR family transcriptional regulator
VDLEQRARRYAALGDPLRLAIVDALAVSDRSAGELARALGVGSNLLAHHLAILEREGIVKGVRSAGDRRRRYLRLQPLAMPINPPVRVPERVLFVCTHNSARSHLAAALWERLIGTRAESAGTHPAGAVHPGAVAAADRAGLSIAANTPRGLSQVDTRGAQVITVCDLAHEETPLGSRWWHWSTPDPVPVNTPQAFDDALDRLRNRISNLGGGP